MSMMLSGNNMMPGIVVGDFTLCTNVRVKAVILFDKTSIFLVYLHETIQFGKTGQLHFKLHTFDKILKMLFLENSIRSLTNFEEMTASKYNMIN